MLTWRRKTEVSLKHKKEKKIEEIRSKKESDNKINIDDEIKNIKFQDLLGFRILLYFQDDVDTVASFYIHNSKDRKKSYIDNLNSDVFHAPTINLTMELPKEFQKDFKDNLSGDFASNIDDTYEIQIRTVYSEGWQEVEHDMRYKCKEDWEGYDSEKRTLYAICGSLECSQSSLDMLLAKMANNHREQKNYRAMFREKFRLRFKLGNFSKSVTDFMERYPEVTDRMLNSDRRVLLFALMTNTTKFDITYDSIFFLVNRLLLKFNAIMDLEQSVDLEQPGIKTQLDDFMKSIQSR